MNKIKVYYEYRTSNNDSHYIEDNPEADYPNEVHVPSTFSTFLKVKEFDFKDIKKAFDEEDGDYDFSTSITYITDGKDRIIFNPKKFNHCKDRQRAEKDLIERAKYQDSKDTTSSTKLNDEQKKLIQDLQKITIEERKEVLKYFKSGEF